MLVDDDDVDRLHVRRVLKAAGLSVELLDASDAEAGLALLRSQAPDCVLLDYHMPGKDGMWFLRQLSPQDLAICPFIVLTGDEEADLVVQVMRAGAIDYLQKSSLNGHRLEHALTSAIETHRARREARRIQAELAESEARFRNIADHAPAMFWVTDASGSCTYLSKRWYEYTGLEPEQSLGVGWLRAVDRENSDSLRAAIEDASRRHEPFSAEFRLRGQHGDYCWYIVSALPRFDDHGQFMGHVGSLVDITERKHSEDQRAHLLERERAARHELECAHRVKDEFLAVVSHELRTPLSAILGWVQLLRSGSLDAEDAGAALETIERNARTQAKLIEDILDVSRVVAGKLQLNIEWIDIGAVVAQALNTVRPSAENKGIELTARLTECPRIMGDSTRLQQVICNLLSNAVKFTPTGGSVELSLSSSDVFVEIQVRDSGQGISAEFLPHVFEPFRQAESGSARRSGGLGLGLAIVRNLVEMHGGSVSACSDGPGHGSIFMIRIPVPSPKEGRDSDDNDSPQANLPAQLSGLRVLLVDDEPDIRHLLQCLLESWQAQVLTASHAEHAWELLQKAKPDLLISDIGLPEQDGYSSFAECVPCPESRDASLPSP